jgi:hypothetical protein
MKVRINTVNGYVEGEITETISIRDGFLHMVKLPNGKSVEIVEQFDEDDIKPRIRKR